MLGDCGVVMLDRVPMLSSVSTWQASYSSGAVVDSVLMAEVACATSLLC